MARFVGRASASLCLLGLVLAVAGHPEARAPGHLSADDSPDDLVALIQQGARSQRRSAASELGRRSHLSNGTMLLLDTVDCSKFPELCQPPFNCHNVNMPALLSQGLRDGGYSATGKVDYQMWCINPPFAPYITKCIAGDVDGAAKVMADMGKAGIQNEKEMNYAASECFLQGHCVNTDVTNSTTVEDSLRMCDERFGHEEWTSAGGAGWIKDSLVARFSNLDKLHGAKSLDEVRTMTSVTCAFGHYHCRVRFCQLHVCKDEYYIRKYGHFLKDYGWVK
mmetsp:Transcript_84230/g.188070  ORF Transcript_84230/g.188070 Transcript_84230/m.188070 type:complete len:279 (-) Transcript_84230:120-956(-)